ncbi:hypothetical protein EIP91_010876 [Steccherinum ochraceum]|uniref:WW domain-containing protein n=1 Tax=Steccherinum ochraceum TaxID=92696 RepID=A0A4V2MX18_9APHY|nr:hypothetical protein EIP91_010876 [Steccherinum ochraceum]
MEDDTEVLDWGNEEDEQQTGHFQGDGREDAEDAVSLGGDEDDNQELAAYQSHSAQDADPVPSALTPQQSLPETPSYDGRHDAQYSRVSESPQQSRRSQSSSLSQLKHALPPKPVLISSEYGRSAPPQMSTLAGPMVHRERRPNGLSKEDSGNSVDLADDLPPDWEARKPRGEDTGKFYYYNIKTQESTWTRPTATSSGRMSPSKDRGPVSARSPPANGPEFSSRPPPTDRNSSGRGRKGRRRSSPAAESMTFDDRHYRPGESASAAVPTEEHGVPRSRARKSSPAVAECTRVLPHQELAELGGMLHSLGLHHLQRENEDGHVLPIIPPWKEPEVRVLMVAYNVVDTPTLTSRLPVPFHSSKIRTTVLAIPGNGPPLLTVRYPHHTLPSLAFGVCIPPEVEDAYIAVVSRSLGRHRSPLRDTDSQLKTKRNWDTWEAPASGARDQPPSPPFNRGPARPRSDVYIPAESVPLRRGRDFSSPDRGMDSEAKRRRLDDRISDPHPSRRDTDQSVSLPSRPMSDLSLADPDAPRRKRDPLPPQSTRFREASKYPSAPLVQAPPANGPPPTPTRGSLDKSASSRPQYSYADVPSGPRSAAPQPQIGRDSDRGPSSRPSWGRTAIMMLWTLTLLDHSISEFPELTPHLAFPPLHPEAPGGGLDKRRLPQPIQKAVLPLLPPQHLSICATALCLLTWRKTVVTAIQCLRGCHSVIIPKVVQDATNLRVLLALLLSRIAPFLSKTGTTMVVADISTRCLHRAYLQGFLIRRSPSILQYLLQVIVASHSRRRLHLHSKHLYLGNFLEKDKTRFGAKAAPPVPPPPPPPLDTAPRDWLTKEEAQARNIQENVASASSQSSGRTPMDVDDPARRFDPQPRYRMTTPPRLAEFVHPDRRPTLEGRLSAQPQPYPPHDQSRDRGRPDNYDDRGRQDDRGSWGQRVAPPPIHGKMPPASRAPFIIDKDGNYPYRDVQPPKPDPPPRPAKKAPRGHRGQRDNNGNGEAEVQGNGHAVSADDSGRPPMTRGASLLDRMSFDAPSGSSSLRDRVDLPVKRGPEDMTGLPPKPLVDVDAEGDAAADGSETPGSRSNRGRKKGGRPKRGKRGGAA